MLKTVKVKKQLRLDELIKYVWDNEIGLTDYVSNDGTIVHVSNLNSVRFEHAHKFIRKHEYFEFEVEEEITEDTVFDRLIEIDIDGGYWDHGHNISIDDVKDEDSLRFYAVINRKLELIWEAE